MITLLNRDLNSQLPMLVDAMRDVALKLAQAAPNFELLTLASSYFAAKFNDEKVTDAATLYHRGFCCEKGVGVAQDLKRAFLFYKEAEKKGDAAALFKLSGCYENGIGIEKNPLQAFKLLQQAAGKKYPAASYKMGISYEHGLGVEQDLQAAISYYRQAAELKYEAAIINLITMGHRLLEGYAKTKDQNILLVASNALCYAKLFAEHPQLDADLKELPGFINSTDLDSEPKTKLTVLYRYMLAKGNISALTKFLRGIPDADSQTQLANLIIKDLNYAAIFISAKVRSLLKAVQEMNSDLIILRYVQRYEEAKFDEPNGAPSVFFARGYCYEYGIGVTRDYYKAFSNYQKAAAQSDSAAMSRVGYLYAHGIGVERNPEKAIDFYQEAINYNDNTAIDNPLCQDSCRL